MSKNHTRPRYAGAKVAPPDLNRLESICTSWREHFGAGNTLVFGNTLAQQDPPRENLKKKRPLPGKRYRRGLSRLNERPTRPVCKEY